MVMLDAKLLFCQAHLEPFRANWPDGYAFALILMFQAFTREKVVWEYAQGDAMRLQNALREFGPACAVIGDELTKRIVRVSLRASETEDLTEWNELQAELLTP